MKVNMIALLEHCIEEGLTSGVYGCDVDLTHDQMNAIIERANRYIWLQIDQYIEFDSHS
jgi:hypothetical protein